MKSKSLAPRFASPGVRVPPPICHLSNSPATPNTASAGGHCEPWSLFRISKVTSSFSNFAPEPITGGGDPRSMVPVRLAGAEVTEAFWAKLAVLF
jgi:hypothetical protein